MTKRFIINGDGLTISQPVGVHRYAAEIIKRIDLLLADNAVKNKIEIWLLVPVNKECRISFQNIAVKKYGIQKDGTIGKNLWQQVSFPKFVKQNQGIGVDLTLAIPMKHCKYIAIHDCIVELFPENYPTLRGKVMRWFYITRVKTVVKRGTHIITVSENSKKDIMRLYHVAPQHITIIGNGWEHMKDASTDEHLLDQMKLTKGNYFFALGSKYRHKNNAWVIEAARHNPNHQFVISGASYEPETEVGRVQEIPQNVQFTGYLEDVAIKTLMTNAKAFLQPSYCEGFGIPPLEALSLGTKIIVANTSCLPEIYEGSAFYIDPDDGNVDLDALLQTETDEIRQQREYVLHKHNWQDSAEKMLAMFMHGKA